MDNIRESGKKSGTSEAVYSYTVIVPHYNSYELLLRLVKSIPLRKDIQLIIVDDNSSKYSPSAERILRDTGRNAEVYCNPSKKHSAGSCRNVGLEHSNGKWLVFADADDCFSEDAFDIMDRYIEYSDDIIFFQTKSIRMPEYTEGTRNVRHERVIREYLKSGRNEYILRYHCHFPWSKMIRSALVKRNNIRFDEVKYSNDVMFSVKCGVYAKKIRAVDCVVYYVTQMQGTLTTRKSFSEYKCRFDVFVDKYLFLKKELNRRDFRRYTEWPAGKIIRAIKMGYGLPMVRYILKRYKECGIKIGFPTIYYFRDIV